VFLFLIDEFTKSNRHDFRDTNIGELIDFASKKSQNFMFSGLFYGYRFIFLPS